MIEKRIKEIMTKDPVMVSVGYTVKEAAALMKKHRISCLPVVEKKNRSAS